MIISSLPKVAVFLILIAGSVIPFSADALSCAMSYPTVGTVSSVTSQGGSEWSSINLNNVGVFDGSLFPSGTVNIDVYNSFAKKFTENGYRVPAEYRRTFTQYETEANVLEMAKTITITTSGVSALQYNIGDVVIAGPPGGATCNMYGFIGFFGSDGNIKSAFAYNNGYADYSYGGETLLVDAGADYSCVAAQYSTDCMREVGYSLNGARYSLRVGESRNLGGSYFSRATLVRSTVNKPPSEGEIMMSPGGSPIRMEHVLSFDMPTARIQNFSASPTSGSVPLAVEFYAISGGNGTVDFGDGTQSPGGARTQQCIAKIGHSEWGCRIAQHTYTSPGTYRSWLQGNTDGNLGSVTITVNSSWTPPGPGTSCPIISRNLSRGSRGSDVTALQQYFISTGVLGTASATGYFGPLTEGAVQEWQSSHGIISYGTPATTGYGAVGPRTRAALARCGN